ncbi:MAG TPA: MerR family DNA-binding transcriptional regulator [Actinospica sp.]|nr:MerR family DNA-binding transcriptional regulator [Actinospica sp.]
MASAGGTRRGRAPLTIGEAVARLSAEFPGIRPETLRALEQHGLVVPERTPSGYRRYTEHDLDAVRDALAGPPPRPEPEPLPEPAYRAVPEPRRLAPSPDTRLAARIPAISAAPPGAAVPAASPVAQFPDEEPPSAGSANPGRRRSARWPEPEYFTPDLGEVALGREGLARAAGIAEEWLDELAAHGLISGREPASGADLLVARAAAELLGYGIEPRHLRQVAVAAERTAALVKAAKGGTSRSAGAQTAAALVRLEAALLRAALLDD